MTVATSVSPLLVVERLSKTYGPIVACDRISFSLYPGQVLGIIGESGSGKTTLLNAIAGHHPIDSGHIHYRPRSGERLNLQTLPEPQLRQILRDEWGFVQQSPRDGLRLNVSAGANIGERLMAVGARHYGNIRAEAARWLAQVEIPTERIDGLPR